MAEGDELWEALSTPLLLCCEKVEFSSWPGSLPSLPFPLSPFPNQQPSGLPPRSQLVCAQKIQTNFHVSAGGYNQQGPLPKQEEREHHECLGLTVRRKSQTSSRGSLLTSYIGLSY